MILLNANEIVTAKGSNSLNIKLSGIIDSMHICKADVSGERLITFVG